MKILFTAHGYKPAWRLGGPVISLSSLAESLVEQGHEVTVFATNSNQDVDLDVATDRFVDVNGVCVRYFQHREPIKALFPRLKYLSQSLGILYAPEMQAALAEYAPRADIIHTNLPYIYPTYIAARAAVRFNKPLFYHQRGVFDPQRLKYRKIKKAIYFKLIERPILRRATTLIALTEFERQSYAALGLTNLCRVIPNGIHLPAPRTPESDALVAQHLGIAPQQQVVVFMGRLHPVKGADRLLAAYLKIVRQHPDAVLVLAGPDEHGIEAGFAAQVRAAGLASQVRFPGMVTEPLKGALLHRANLFCLPSQAEGFSMAILEALAHSTAVLISPGCHFAEVASAQAGRIVEPEIDTLASALHEMLLHPQQLTIMGEQGKALVENKYTWPAIAHMMIAAYEEGIQRHARLRKV